MKANNVKVGDIVIGQGQPLTLIAGPCVIESEESVLEHARRIREISDKVGIPFIFKASYDKANRSSHKSFRGIGIKKGLEALAKVRSEVKVPVLSDVHSVNEVDMAGEILDVIQIPAFLCRQTDLLVKAAETQKTVNVKKGQFMSPGEMKNVVEKIEHAGNKNILLTERGTTFGYNMLINDFRSIVIMKETGYPVVYDATHSVQMPGGKGTSSGGESQYVLPLTKAAVATGCDAIFCEVHIDPPKALSDGPNMLSLEDLEGYLNKTMEIAKVVR